MVLCWGVDLCEVLIHLIVQRVGWVSQYVYPFICMQTWPWPKGREPMLTELGIKFSCCTMKQSTPVYKVTKHIAHTSRRAYLVISIGVAGWVLHIYAIQTWCCLLHIWFWNRCVNFSCVDVQSAVARLAAISCNQRVCHRFLFSRWAQ